MRYRKKYYNGEVPESGAIFMSNIGTRKECLRRNLCGLPSGMTDFVLQVKKGMTLFLFEYERRLLYGVYRATSDGHINIEPRAFRSSGKCFPAQVRFTSVWDCSPLAEHEFQDAIRDNYVSVKKFNFGLNKDQVSKLMNLFQSKRSSKSLIDRHALRCGDKSTEENSKFGHLRKDMRDRLRFVSDKDGDDDPYICDSVSEDVKEVDDHFYSTKNSVEVRQKDTRDGFETSYKTHDSDFTDCVTRQDVLGKHHEDDHSFGGVLSRSRVPDAGLTFTGDANEGKKVLTNEDSFFMMENNRKRDIDDGYIPPFTKPHEKQLYGEVISIARNDAKILIDGKKDDDDFARMDDEYNNNNNNNVSGGFGQNISEYHLGSPSAITSQTTNDRYEYSNEAVDNELRKLNEQSLSKPVYNSEEDNIFRPTPLIEQHHPVVYTPKETTFGIKPDDDKYNGFEYFSLVGQSRYSLSHHDPTTIKEVSDSRLSYFADGSSFIPLDDGPPIYLTTSNESPVLLPVSPYSPSHPHIEGSMRYFENPDYASFSRSQQHQLTVEGNPLCDTALLLQQGSKISSLYPDFISKKRLSSSSSDAGLCVRKEDPIDNGRRFCRPRSSSDAAGGSRMREEDHPVNNHKRSYQSRESSKHCFGNNKRISVFARLNSAAAAAAAAGIGHEKQESENDGKKHELDASVDKVMEMLEKAVSSPHPTKRIGKTKSASKKGDSDIANHLNKVVVIDHELRMDVDDADADADADVADEETEDGSPLQPETRIVDFKRRKKATKCCTDDSSKENLVGPTSHVLNNNNNNKLMGGGESSCKRRKLVRPGGFITENKLSSADDCVCVAINKTDVLQSCSSNSDTISTQEVNENSVDKFVDINMIPNPPQNTTPFEDEENKSTTVEAVESSSSEKIIESIKTVEDVHQKIPSNRNSSLTEAVTGNKDKVDVPVVESLVVECQKVANEGGEKCEKDGNAEIASFKDSYNSTNKTEIEVSDKADVSIKSVQLPPAECEKSGCEGQETSKLKVCGSEENRIVSDGFVEAIKVSSSKDDQKMCGWIEW